MSLSIRRTVLVASSVLLSACGGSDEAQPQMEEARESMADAVQQMQEAAQNLNANPSSGALIPATTLQERLPSSLDGMARTSSERSESGAMGFKVSTASATYGEGDRTIEVTLTDMGGTGMMAMVGAAWAMVDMDQSDDNGFERTVTIDGNRGFEKEERSGDARDSELSVIANQRVLVKLEGHNVSVDVLRDALKALRVSELVRAP